MGIGGMGVVYKARDEELGTEVAIKVLRPDLGSDPQWLERFRRELVLAREVTHPNVVRIHDIGEDQGLRFLTMRFVAGRSLLRVLAEDGPLPLDRAVNILRQLAEALQEAHRAGVVHRDLKPGNVLVAPDDTAFVTDFGVARSLLRDSLTRAGAVVGTPDYLSPEQIAGDPVDARSDLYALGIVFYEMLTARLPFRGDTHAEVLAQRIAGRTRSLREAGVSAPAWAQGVIDRLLERNPARRYASAGELLRDLDRRQVPPRTFTRVRVAGVVALVAALAGAWTLARLRAREGAEGSPPTAVPAGPSLVVLPLAEETGDPALAWTGRGIAEMLAGQLSGSPGLRVVDAARVFRTLSDMQMGGGRLDDARLPNLSELFEVDHVVTGAVRRAGRSLRVDLRLVQVGPGSRTSTRHLSAETAEPAGLFRAVTGLGEQVRAALGPAASAAEPAAPLTTSLDAAQAYREGRERLLVGDSVAAAPAFERAVAADPAFAAALERLSETYQTLGYQEKATGAAEKAARAVRPTERRLALRIQARLALLKGDPAEAERTFAELVRLFPNDTEALLDLASAQSSQGNLSKATETLRRAAERDRSDPRVWLLLGRNAILMGDAARALRDDLVRALALQSQLRSEQGRGDVLNAMGVAHHELGDYKQAAERYAEAAAIRERVGDQRGWAGSLKNLARVRLAMGNFEGVEADLGKAAQIYERIGDQAGLADVQNERGSLYEARGDYAAAQQGYQAALRLRHGLGDQRQIAQSYDNIGYIFFLQGEYESARVYWSQALEGRRRIGEKNGVVLSRQNLGFLHTAQGRWSEAMRAFLEALEESRAIDFKNAVAVSKGNIGLLQQYQGRYGAALASFDEALAVLKELDDKQGLGEFTLKQAAALLELGDLEGANRRLEAAETWVREADNRERSSDYEVLRAEVLRAQGQAGPAHEALARALEHATASHSRTAILRARLAQSVARAEDDPVRGASAVKAVARDAEVLGEVPLRLQAAEALARAELWRGQPAAAAEAARRGLALAEKTGWEAGLFRLHALLAEAAQRRGQTADAARHRQESARLLDRVRAEVPEALRATFDLSAAARSMRKHPAARAAGAS